jgi:hypothetical protein
VEVAMNTIKRIIQFFTSRPIYSFGFGVTFCTYWTAHGPKMEGFAEIAINFGFALIVSAFSWCYPIARLINTFCV